MKLFFCVVGGFIAAAACAGSADATVLYDDGVLANVTAYQIHWRGPVFNLPASGGKEPGFSPALADFGGVTPNIAGYSSPHRRSVRFQYLGNCGGTSNCDGHVGANPNSFVLTISTPDVGPDGWSASDPRWAFGIPYNLDVDGQWMVQTLTYDVTVESPARFSDPTIASAVPELPTWSMFLLGFAGFVFVGRLQSQSTRPG